MKLKVTICNKALWSDYYKFLSVISVITSLIFLFYDIPKAYKNICAVMLFALFLLVFLGQWARANLLRKVTLMINDSEIDIEEGDILVIRKNATPHIGDIIVALDENNENTLKCYGGIDGETGKAVLEYQNKAVYGDKVILVNELICQGVLSHIIKER